MPSKLYLSPGNPVVWTHSGGDRLLDARGLLYNGGRVCGAYLDLGPAPRADRYEVELYIDGFSGDSDGIPILGKGVEVHFIQSEDGVNWDGPPTTAPTVAAQGTITREQLRHGKFAGIVRVWATSPTITMIGRRNVRLTSRYVAPVVVNNVDEVLGVTGNHSVTLREIPYEQQ